MALSTKLLLILWNERGEFWITPQFSYTFSQKNNLYGQVIFGLKPVTRDSKLSSPPSAAFSRSQLEVGILKGLIKNIKNIGHRSHSIV